MYMYYVCIVGASHLHAILVCLVTQIQVAYKHIFTMHFHQSQHGPLEGIYDCAISGNNKKENKNDFDLGELSFYDVFAWAPYKVANVDLFGKDNIEK